MRMIPRSVSSISSPNASPVSFAPGKCTSQVVDGSHIRDGLCHLVLLNARPGQPCLARFRDDLNVPPARAADIT